MIEWPRAFLLRGRRDIGPCILEPSPGGPVDDSSCFEVPRRRLLLDQIGVAYATVDAPIDEVPHACEPPERFVERMACEKALAGLAAVGDALAAPVLAADTAVVLDDRVLGKPRNAAHAMEMLEALSGRMHRVISVVAIVGGNAEGPVGDDGPLPDIATAGGPSPRFRTSISRVWFREISREERRAYCATGEPLDKAGAYAIQGAGRDIRHPPRRKLLPA